MREHMLMFPEGDHRARRHAHTDCVLRARARGELPTLAEWERAQPGFRERVGFWRRLRGER